VDVLEIVLSAGSTGFELYGITIKGFILLFLSNTSIFFSPNLCFENEGPYRKGVDRNGP